MNIQKPYNIGVIVAGWIAARNPENLEKVRSDFNIPDKTNDYHNIFNK